MPQVEPVSVMSNVLKDLWSIPGYSRSDAVFDERSCGACTAVDEDSGTSLVGYKLRPFTGC